MESNRQGTVKELAPTAILLKTMFIGEANEKGSAECVLEVVGRKLISDSNGVETEKLIIEIKSISKIDGKKARVW